MLKRLTRYNLAANEELCSIENVIQNKRWRLTFIKAAGEIEIYVQQLFLRSYLNYAVGESRNGLISRNGT